MPDKKESIKEFILNNPSESGNWIYQEAKKVGLGIRKTNFLAIVREVRNLSKVSTEKKAKSIPIKYRSTETKIKILEYEVRDLSRKTPSIETKTKIRESVKEITKLERKVKPKPKAKPKVKIPYEKTKFGKMAKTFQTKLNISEQNAIEHTRKMLKIPKTDYDLLNQKDYDILTHYGY